MWVVEVMLSFFIMRLILKNFGEDGDDDAGSDDDTEGDDDAGSI